MPLKIPDMDDRSFTDLVEEGRSLLSRYAPEWTNHNPSDPGITLIELLAYFTEILIYRLNRVTRENKIKFLQLLGMADPAEQRYPADRNTPVEEVDKALIKAVQRLREPRRAVTAEDYEKLAQKLTACIVLEEPEMIRTCCFPRQNLESDEKTADRPGHLSLVIVPGSDLEPDELEYLTWKVRNELEPMRLLTTQLHVVKPFYVWLSIWIKIHVKSDSYLQKVHDRALEDFQKLVNPFGRSVYISEIWAILKKIENVDFVKDVGILKVAETSASTTTEQSAFGLQIGVRSTLGIDSRIGGEATMDMDRVIRSDAGKLIGIRLRPYELVKIEVIDITPQKDYDVK